MGKPFKLALKEGLQTGSAGRAVVGTVASGVTYLARHEEWVIQSGLFAAGAFGLAIGLYYLSTLLKPRYIKTSIHRIDRDWRF